MGFPNVEKRVQAMRMHELKSTDENSFIAYEIALQKCLLD
jgi:hypothetical protein